MEIILKEEVDNIGPSGTRTEVADGYARNYLIPKGLAVEATEGNLKILEREREIEEIKRRKELKQARRVAARIKKTSLTITREVGEQDKLYGSVTTKDIADALAQEGIVVDKKYIELDDPIKSLGVFNVPIRLHEEVTSKVKVWVVRP